jgi:hypothetical protein
MSHPCLSVFIRGSNWVRFYQFESRRRCARPRTGLAQNWVRFHPSEWRGRSGVHGTGSAENWVRSSKKGSAQPLPWGAPSGPGYAITFCFTSIFERDWNHIQSLAQPRRRFRGQLGDRVLAPSRAVRGQRQNWVRFLQAESRARSAGPDSARSIRPLYTGNSPELRLGRISQPAPRALLRKAGSQQ